MSSKYPRSSFVIRFDNLIEIKSLKVNLQSKIFTYAARLFINNHTIHRNSNFTGLVQETGNVSLHHSVTQFVPSLSLVKGWVIVFNIKLELLFSSSTTLMVTRTHLTGFYIIDPEEASARCTFTHLSWYDLAPRFPFDFRLFSKDITLPA